MTKRCGLCRSFTGRARQIWERFEDAAQYLQMRRQTEGSAAAGVSGKGRFPKELYPIYMVLGKTKWMQTALDPATVASTEEVVVPLALFEAGDISFTYPDSMVSAMVASQKDPAYYLPEYHGQVFTLSEISTIVGTYGLPGKTWGANLPSHLANYVEAQIRNHQPAAEIQAQRLASRLNGVAI